VAPCGGQTKKWHNRAALRRAAWRSNARVSAWRERAYVGGIISAVLAAYRGCMSQTSRAARSLAAAAVAAQTHGGASRQHGSA